MGSAKMAQQNVIPRELTATLVARIVLTLGGMQVGLNVTGEVARSSNDEIAVGTSEGACTFRGRLLQQESVTASICASSTYRTIVATLQNFPALGDSLRRR